MARYLLDSDTLDYLHNAGSPFHLRCLNQFMRRLEDEFCLSILTIYEIDYSIEAASEPLAKELRAAKFNLLEAFSILPLSLHGSATYAKLKASLKAQSKSKAKAMKSYTVDIILAATALEHDAAVVSNDRVFGILQGIEPKLKVENWAS